MGWGVPRKIRSLLDLAFTGMLRVGTVFQESDEGELAIHECNEMINRHVVFKKYDDKLRHGSPEKNETLPLT